MTKEDKKKAEVAAAKHSQYLAGLFKGGKKKRSKLTKKQKREKRARQKAQKEANAAARKEARSLQNQAARARGVYVDDMAHAQAQAGHIDITGMGL